MLLLLVYSNNIEYPLSYVRSEEVEVDGLLDDLDAKGILRYKIISTAKGIEDLTRWLRHERSKDLVFFGYSGHSTGTQLVLENEHIRCKGLAKLIGRRNCPNIKVVFLNGCLTYLSRSFFEDSGIPIIISTTGLVDDGLAKIFSKIFFEGLAENKTVYDSFKKALASVECGDQISGHERICGDNQDEISEDNKDKDVPQWQISFKEERFKAWNFNMGINDPKPTLSKEHGDKIILIRNLKGYKTLFDDDVITPKDCVNLNSLLFQINQKIDLTSSMTINETIVLETIDKIRPLISFVKVHCSSIKSDRGHRYQGKIKLISKYILYIIQNIR